MTKFYNTQHSPLGAFASFTLGAKGAKGGLGLELGKPADQNIFIGLERDGEVRCLPFFDQIDDDSVRFEVGSTGRQDAVRVVSFADDEIERNLEAGRDSWQVPGLRFSVFSPAMSAPDPSVAAEATLRDAYVPAVMVEVEVDNGDSDLPARLVFGFQGTDPAVGMRLLDETCAVSGIASGASVAIVGKQGPLRSGLGFTVGDVLEEQYDQNRGFTIGTVGLLTGAVAPRARQVFQMAICFHRSGMATTGMDCSYFYTRFFPKLEDVAMYAVEHFDNLKARSDEMRALVAASGLNEARRFMFCQALHSYYGSTELLEAAEGPLWIVNEGEYRMMNTFDLMVDQAYFENRFNPWTLRNELEWYVRRYSYEDALCLPGSDEEHPGGISFSHDMGITNHFSPAGKSAYEKTGLHGCFSHMTQEELVNWLACFLMAQHTGPGESWTKRMLPVAERGLESMLRRDHVDPDLRDGVMSFDSSRCSGGSEITTYDSLDVSLGQARNNLYLAVRCWGVYVGLEAFFAAQGDSERMNVCRTQAHRAAATICEAVNADGTLPAVLHENVQSRIIPAVEGLALPQVLGLQEALQPSGEYGELIAVLKGHLQAVLNDGICLFPDGGWKVSSTSNNSWLSKIYLCQFVAEKILGVVAPDDMARADEAHRAWLLNPKSLYWAWSDQMLDGVALGSKYYPRGVTSILWFEGGVTR